jgi:integrase/recombinase XerD
MVKLNLRYLVKDIDRHGNERFYVRKPGNKKVRLRSTLGTSAFHREYERALASSSLPTKEIFCLKSNSLEYLCNLYLSSHELRALAVSTRAWRRRALVQICIKYGQLPFNQMEAPDVRMLVREKAETPGAARNRLKALKALFAWSVENDYMKRNPSVDVKFKMPPTDGFHTWIDSEMEKYKAFHPPGSKARLAFLLLRHVGCRRSDVVKLGWGNVDAGWIKYRVTKNSTRRSLEVEWPIHPELAEELELAKGRLLFLQTEWGKGYSVNGFGNRFREWCNAAGLPHCSAHGVRKAAATDLMNNNGTGGEIMTFLAHATVQQADPYVRRADRRALAASASEKIRARTKNSPTGS